MEATIEQRPTITIAGEPRLAGEWAHFGPKGEAVELLRVVRDTAEYGEHASRSSGMGATYMGWTGEQEWECAPLPGRVSADVLRRHNASVRKAWRAAREPLCAQLQRVRLELDQSRRLAHLLGTYLRDVPIRLTAGPGRHGAEMLVGGEWVAIHSGGGGGSRLRPYHDPREVYPHLENRPRVYRLRVLR